MNRRSFLQLFGAAAAGAVLDPEMLLWRPGAKTIFLPAAKTLTTEEVIAVFKQVYGADALARLASLEIALWKNLTYARGSSNHLAPPLLIGGKRIEQSIAHGALAVRRVPGVLGYAALAADKADRAVGGNGNRIHRSVALVT